MRGEELSLARVSEQGVFGDRADALVDDESGKIIAPRTRENGAICSLGAQYASAAGDASVLPAALIEFPDGSTASSAEPDAQERVSGFLNRRVRLTASVPQSARAEGYWPDFKWLEQPDSIFEFELPAGTFFDGATIHLITTATLEKLTTLAPGSRFEVARFRPNFVIDIPGSTAGFIENKWTGHTLSIGSEVLMRVVRPTFRCVMTTLAQGDLPKDPDVLRTVVQNNDGNIGVYATVVRGGTVRRGDAVAVA